MSAAVDAKGLKRVCVECGIRFYDMNKRPIICPNCETEFTGELKLKGRRGRVAAPVDPLKAEVQNVEKTEAKVANDEVEEEEEDGVEIVSLDDAEILDDAELLKEEPEEGGASPVIALDSEDSLDGLEMPLEGLSDDLDEEEELDEVSDDKIE